MERHPLGRLARGSRSAASLSQAAAAGASPPLATRPRELSVTAIETWMRDPYAIYARKILGLEALEPIDADPGAAITAAVQRAGRLPQTPSAGPLAGGGADDLLDLGRRRFDQALARPGLWAFWWPRFQRVAAWFVAHEAARRPLLAETRSEIGGALELAAPGGSFRLTAKADRVDRLADGGLVIVDYKTGAPPTTKEVAAGPPPQLPLEAAIAAHGGFPGVPAGEVRRLLYAGSPAASRAARSARPATSRRLADQALKAWPPWSPPSTSRPPPMPPARIPTGRPIQRLSAPRPGQGMGRGEESERMTVDPEMPQRRAADPQASVWVAASAGTGKTNVSDRPRARPAARRHAAAPAAVPDLHQGGGGGNGQSAGRAPGRLGGRRRRRPGQGPVPGCSIGLPPPPS